MPANPMRRLPLGAGAGGANPSGRLPLGPGAGGPAPRVLPEMPLAGAPQATSLPPGVGLHQGGGGSPLSLGANVGGAGAYQYPSGSPTIAQGGITSPGTFGKSAPTPTEYGAFTGPDLSQIGSDPYYQFRLKEGNNAMQRSAAARGTLLTGGLQKRLAGFNQGLASEEGQNIFNRALLGYTTNRDTNAQNFGQKMGAFQGDLSAFNANTSATLGFNSNALADKFGTYDRQYGAAADARGIQDRQQATAADAYANAIAAQRAQGASNAAAFQAGYANDITSPASSTFGRMRLTKRAWGR